MQASPFGKYSEGVAAVVALAIIFSWLLGQLINPAGVTSQLDNMSWVCIGYIFARPVASAVIRATNAEHQNAVLTSQAEARQTRDDEQNVAQN